MTRYYMQCCWETILFQEQRPEVFCKNVFHSSFAKFTGKHLCQSLFFNKVAGLADFLRTKNTSGWLLPKLDFFRLIFLNNVLFQMQNLYVFKLAWHWLADKQCCYSCLYDVLLLYRYLKTLQWCRVSTAVRGIS